MKFLQSVGGSEYVNEAFVAFLANHGIQHRLFYSHTPQQNRIAERKHRHIVEIGLSLLHQAFMPHQFWMEVFSTTVILIYRLPTPTLGL